jgi:hypothetical protein
MLYSELPLNLRHTIGKYITDHISYYQTVEIKQALHCNDTLHVGEILDAKYNKGGVYKDDGRVVADNEDSLIDYFLKVIH